MNPTLSLPTNHPTNPAAVGHDVPVVKARTMARASQVASDSLRFLGSHGEGGSEGDFCGCNAGFQTCCIADFQIGKPSEHRRSAELFRFMSQNAWEKNRSSELSPGPRPALQIPKNANIKNPLHPNMLRVSPPGNLSGTLKKNSRLMRGQFSITRSAGFQTCCIADFQFDRSYDVVRPANLETSDPVPSFIENGRATHAAIDDSLHTTNP